MTSSPASGLEAAPYGGVLIQRLTRREVGPAAGEPVLTVGDVVESDFIHIAVGAFSPLTGFQGSADFASVCRSLRLSGSGLVWPLPILFDITDVQKREIAGAPRVFLRSATTGRVFGIIEPREIYPHDKETHIAGAFGVSDDAHPGVKRVRAMGPWLLAGEVTAFRDDLDPDPLAYPAGVREHLARLGLRRVAGFQTRNVVHRAHEYLQRVALELTGGLLVHPMVGWKKPGDFRPEVIRHSYARFIERTYPGDRVVLAFLRVAMRYAGPREAVFHALIRKNYGCTHFIVGRDHAGVGSFYDTYASHEIFDRLPDLGIGILRLREPFFCKRCDSVATDRTCGHDESDRERISGTRIRKILADGIDPGNHLFRREVLESLEGFRSGGLFCE